jgi:hypothetical protein
MNDMAVYATTRPLALRARSRLRGLSVYVGVSAQSVVLVAGALWFSLPGRPGWLGDVFFFT